MKEMNGGGRRRWIAALGVVLAGFVASADAAETGEAPVAAPAAEQRFDVWEYRVLGSSVLSNLEIEHAVYPFLGPQRSLQDVEAARGALEKEFHDRGFGTVFVDVPEQDVDEGVVRLHVTEGKLRGVRVTEARYFSGRQIRAALPQAEPSKVPHLPTLQAQLTQLNAQTADRAVTPVLKAGPVPGTVDLALRVDDHVPLHSSLGINNQYTADTSHLRAAASVSYDNLFGRLDSLSFQYQWSPEETSEVAVWAASYTARLTDAGTKLAFFYVDSDSDVASVGDGGATVPVLGRGQVMGARLIVPLVANASGTHTFIGGIEYKDFRESVFSESVLETPITYVDLSAGHVSVWRGEKHQLLLSSSAHFGARGLANEGDEFAIKRFHGKPNYFLVRADGTLSYDLPFGLRASWRTAGQYAVDPVISNEQFSAAGADGVRGYLEAEQLSDVGIKSSIELASPRWTLWSERLHTDLFAFFDYGRLSRIDPLYEVIDPATGERGLMLERPNVTLRSAGIGWNVFALDHFSANLTWAYPLVDRPSITIDADPSKGTRRGDSRLHFSVLASW